MNTAVRTILATVLVIGAVLLPGAPAAASTTAVRTDESAPIDAWVEERMAARGLPGAAVAVVRDGAVVHQAGYGDADPAGRAVTPDTPFIIGSTSKPFTAVVVGQLVEEGVLSLDEPVWPYLSELVGGAPDGFEQITVEQLLTHTGGLGMFNGTAGTVKIHDGADALDRRVDDLLSKRLAADPGESFVYSNAGFMLLASVVEQVTGRSFADELRDRVFDPLEMTGTFATADDPRAADMATGHQQWFGRWRPVELPYDDAGVAMGYIASTTRDLVTFMQAHLDGHPAIPATAADIASGPVTPTDWATTLDAGYGHGWFVDEIAGTPVVSHPGSLGHFTGHVLMAPEEGLGVAVVTNASAIFTGHETQYDIGIGLMHTLLGEEPVYTEPSPLITVVAPVLAWLAVALLIGALIRSVLRLRAHGLPDAPRHGARGWVRALLPGAALVAVGGAVFVAPHSLARQFYPDGGWALTVAACIAVVWGVVRLTAAGAGGVRHRRSASVTDPTGSDRAAAPPTNARSRLNATPAAETRLERTMSRTRRIAHIVVATVVALLTLGGVAYAGMMSTINDISEAPPRPDGWPASRPSGPGPISVAVVLGQSVTVGSDLLAPYEVFASSPEFSVYTVAERDDPAPITGGPTLVPAHTFAEVDAGVAPAPDVVVVPAVGDPAGEQEREMRQWIASQHDRGAHIFGVCAGSLVLAEAGVLDGLRATSHWGRLDALDASHPEVDWVRGHRYVQDGSVTTTAGITSGIPGALKVVEDLAGADEAARIGRAVNYPGWSLDAPATIPEQRLTLSDLPVLARLVAPWMKPTVGVAVTEGVGEIDLAAVFEAYATSYAAHPVAIAPGDTIETRHGIVLVTTPTSDDPDVDRVVAPGATSASAIDPQLRQWAGDRGLDIEPLRSSNGEAGFDAALEDLAAQSTGRVALTVAKVVDYPVAHLDLAGSGPEWRVGALLILTLGLAVGAGLLANAVMKAVRRRRARSVTA